MGHDTRRSRRICASIAPRSASGDRSRKPTCPFNCFAGWFEEYADKAPPEVVAAWLKWARRAHESDGGRREEARELADGATDEQLGDPRSAGARAISKIFRPERGGKKGRRGLRASSRAFLSTRAGGRLARGNLHLSGACLRTAALQETRSGRTGPLLGTRRGHTR